jgi:bacteriocin-like protein
MTDNPDNLSSLEVEYQELSNDELETVVGGTYKKKGAHNAGTNSGGVIINNNNNNNDNTGHRYP